MDDVNPVNRPKNISEISDQAVELLNDNIKCPYTVVGSRLKCTACNVKKVDEKELGIHIKAVHKVKAEKGPWKCPLRYEGCKTQNLFKDAMFAHVFDSHYCETCNGLKMDVCNQCGQ